MNPEIMILTSGGIDSTGLISFYKNLNRPIINLFVDYGQPACISELKAVMEISHYYNTQLKIVRYHPVKIKTSGYIPGRNAFLLITALMERMNSITEIAIGIHAGTNYVDCDKLFIKRMQSVYNLYENEKVKVSAPFMKFFKNEVYEYCDKMQIPFHLTYSCESGNKPCGKCLSCKDRNNLNARKK